MGFNDLPVVDKSGGNSERSGQKLKSLLSIQSGFILREDVPDYGCDFDAELIIESKQASNHRFPIQLKSAEKLKIIEDGKYISYSFETSRLGYLMRRVPAGGIIVLYAVAQDECYFEYCDRIYERIMEEKQSDSWFANDSINIHIPVSNKLTKASVESLHHTFKNRFDQAAIMQNSMGRKYGLPSVISGNQPKYDFNNVEHVKRFLQEHGMLLLNAYDLHITFGMISRIPMTEIYGNIDLLLIAAVSYSEMGMHAESKLFTSRLSRYDLPEETKLLFHFVEMKNDLALGYLDTNQFIDALEDLSQKGVPDENKITIEINLINYKLARKKPLEPIPANILQQINNVFAQIGRLPPSTRKKELLTLWNCENLSLLVTTIGSDTLGDFALRESMGATVSQEERKAASTEQIMLESQFHKLLHSVNKKAVESSDKVLNAHVFSQDVRHYISSQINYAFFEVPVNKMPGFEKRLLEKINIAATAYNKFMELHLPNYAYDNLCNMIDLIELAEKGYNIRTTYDRKKLYEFKEKMEMFPQALSRRLIFPALLAQKRQLRENQDKAGTDFLKDFNDTQIETLARSTLESMNLPEDRLPHIVHEMKAHRMFYQRCLDPDIDFVQGQSPYHQYTKDLRFVLRNKKSGLHSLPSSDMNALLTSWGF